MPSTWDTLQKILDHPEPPGYRRVTPRTKPKLDPFLPVVHQILQVDKKAPRKQRHTTIRIFQRLRDEYGYSGGLTAVKIVVATSKRRSAEVFVPLAHRPGEAQVDLGEAEIHLDALIWRRPEPGTCEIKKVGKLPIASSGIPDIFPNRVFRH